MRAAVLGSPISHSKSPDLHRAAYRAAGLDWTYEAIDVDSAQLPGFLSGLGEDWAGLSLTMPLKETVLDLVDSISATVRATRAANTLVFAAAPGREIYRGTAGASEGGAVAHNTDVDGIVAAIRESTGQSFRPRNVAVLGAGATARSATVAAARLGAEQVRVHARRPAVAEASLADVAAASGVPLAVLPWADAPAAARADLVISTVPTGVTAELAEEISRGRAPSGVLLDVVYHPWPSPLAQAWTGANGTAVSGLLMLLHQAAEQVRLMAGINPDTAAMREAVGL